MNADASAREIGPAWQAALDQGLDMSLVELSLRKTPWQRMLDHDAALDFALALRKAGRKLYAEPPRDDSQAHRR
jgi:hypothetical protein